MNLVRTSSFNITSHRSRWRKNLEKPRHRQMTPWRHQHWKSLFLKTLPALIKNTVLKDKHNYGLENIYKQISSVSVERFIRSRIAMVQFVYFIFGWNLSAAKFRIITSQMGNRFVVSTNVLSAINERVLRYLQQISVVWLHLAFFNISTLQTARQTDSIGFLLLSPDGLKATTNRGIYFWAENVNSPPSLTSNWALFSHRRFRIVSDFVRLVRTNFSVCLVSWIFRFSEPKRGVWRLLRALFVFSVVRKITPKIYILINLGVLAVHSICQHESSLKSGSGIFFSWRRFVSFTTNKQTVTLSI